jgi:hypothetical protein
LVIIRSVAADPDRWLGADRYGVVKAVDLAVLCEAIRESWQDAAPRGVAHRHEFDRIVRTIASGVTAGSAVAVDDAIWFLDADPWCIYSGCAKATIMRRLISAPMTDMQRDRLAAIVLAAVDIGWRWEFPDTVKLARRIGGRPMRVGLRARLHAADLPAARRAAIALVRLRQPRLSERDRRRARGGRSAEVFGLSCARICVCQPSVVVAPGGVRDVVVAPGGRGVGAATVVGADGSKGMVVGGVNRSGGGGSSRSLVGVDGLITSMSAMSWVVGS